MCEKSKFIRSYEKMVWGRLFSFDSIAFGKHWKYIVLLRSAKCPFVCKRCLVCTSPQVNRLFIFVYLFGFFFLVLLYFYVCCDRETCFKLTKQHVFYTSIFYVFSSADDWFIHFWFKITIKRAMTICYYYYDRSMCVFSSFNLVYLLFKWKREMSEYACQIEQQA